MGIEQNNTGVNKALILAAGNGTRLQSSSHSLPKPLFPVGGVPLLQRVILDARAGGIEEFFIVVGHLGTQVRDYFTRQPVDGVSLSWIHNNEYEKGNGISVLQARNVIQEPFMLLMSDHIFHPDTARLLRQRALTDREVILGVDRKLDLIFDMDDATKVHLSGDRIIDIGKKLSMFEAIDTGMFSCHPDLFTALHKSIRNGDCSLSDGIRVMAQDGHAQAFDIQEARWFDIDTLDAAIHAEQVLQSHIAFQSVQRATRASVSTQ